MRACDEVKENHIIGRSGKGYQTRIGFMWPSTFGLAATLASGALLSVLTRTRPAADALRLTWWAVMER